MQQSRPVPRLPRRDTWMMGLMLAIMIVTDIAAALTGIPDKARPALVLLPASLAGLWAAYVLTFRAGARRHAGNDMATGKLARFMGGSLSLVGGLLAIEHVALVGSYAWFGPVAPETFVRVFMAAIGVVLIVLFNRAPKVMAGVPMSGFPGVGAFFSGSAMFRETAWAGVACGAAIVGLALFAPLGRMAGWVFLIGLIPSALQIGLALTRRRR